jgi:hypothetical protein
LAAILLIAVLILATFVRWSGLGAKHLWLDESLSWRLIQFPVDEMIDRTGQATTANPPLYFLLLRGWCAVWGESEVALRSLSVVFALIAIVGIYAMVRVLRFLPSTKESRLSQSLNGRGIAFLATVLVALSPLAIYISQQARAYSLGTALYIWSSWALIRALTTPGSGKGFWALYGFLALAFCYTHYLALFLIASQVVFIALFGIAAWWAALARPSNETGQPAVLLMPRQGLAFRTAWAVGVLLALGLGYFPWVGRMLAQSERLREHSWHEPVALEQFPQAIGTALSSTVAAHERVSSLMCWALMLGLLWMFLHLARHGQWVGTCLTVLSLGPLAFIFIWSLRSGRSLIHIRYLAFIQPLWLTSLAVTCGFLPRLGPAVAGCALVVVQAYACAANWSEIGPGSAPGMRAVMTRIEQQRVGSEPVLVENPFVLLPAVYYARGEMRPLLATTVPVWRMLPQSAQLKQEDLIDPHDFLAEESTSGFWCISCSSYGSSPGVWFSTEGWKRESIKVFAQDNPWENPLYVEHYIRNNPADPKAP